MLSAQPLTLPIKPVVWVLFMLAFAQNKSAAFTVFSLSGNIDCKKRTVRFLSSSSSHDTHLT